MKVKAAESVEAQPVAVEGAKDVRIRWLVHGPDGAKNFYLRQFELAPGGHTPKHAHAYEHEVFVLEGSGAVLEGDIEHPLRPGTVVYVPPSQVHQFRNTGPGPLKFLCLIPHPLRDMAAPCAAACSCD